ncbi:hypothetical protein RND71_010259 [Anisodus tanguticus]|uniref:Uncharacterized protein n=1 Tax=Anisodus tanguticus TaxID=243964 RepID=A0AAE1SHF0_9SOLA|nr:hypothetical protein RND71_010259 [Anisodus tanguticus]
MVHFHPGFSRYLFFVLDLYASVTVVESLMMVIASVVHNFLMGIVIEAGIQGIFMVVSWFFRLPHDIPKPVWRYPVSYITFDFWVIQIEVNRSKWVDLSVIFSMIIIYRVIFFIMIKISEEVTPWVRGYVARRKMQQKEAGFPCPTLRNPSDHFLRCINSDFDKVKATLRGSIKFGQCNDDPIDKMTTAEAIRILILISLVSAMTIL